MTRYNVLVCEISGKRPGDKNKRPTEKFKCLHDHLIISNNSDDYVTDWKILNVPEDYRNWYIENVKSSENFFWAQMNRSYALKYAKEHGYDYCIQLDDNIISLEIAYRLGKGALVKEYRAGVRENEFDNTEMLDDFIDLLVTVLENTNAGVAGCSMMSAPPSDGYINERYCYSLFAVDLKRCPEIFHGDFEDDIEYRLKLKQLNVPEVCVVPLRYGKTSQRGTGDTSGCREEYVKAGVKRGEHMSKLYGDIYSAGWSEKSHSVGGAKVKGGQFLHKLKPFKLGVLVYDMEPIDKKMKWILSKYAQTCKDSSKITVK